MSRFLLSLFLFFQLACFSESFSFAYLTDSLGEVYRLKINQESISDVQIEKILTASQSDIAGNVVVSPGSNPLGKHLFIATSRDQTTTVKVYDATGNYERPVSSIEVPNFVLSSIELSPYFTRLIINGPIQQGSSPGKVLLLERKFYSINASGELTFEENSDPGYVLPRVFLEANGNIITIEFNQDKPGLAQIRKGSDTASFQTNLNVTSVVSPVDSFERLQRSMSLYNRLFHTKAHRRKQNRNF